MLAAEPAPLLLYYLALTIDRKIRKRTLGLVKMLVPSFKSLRPASERATAAAQGSSLKENTRPERLLRLALRRNGIKYRKGQNNLAGKPDIVFQKARIAIFCDGDFWHGKDWLRRKAKLKTGTNAQYWIAKIERNIERDKETVITLQSQGWLVMRFWESEIEKRLDLVLSQVLAALKEKRH